MKSIEFKQAGLAAPANIVAEASASAALLPAASSTADLRGAGAARPVLAASTRSATSVGAPQSSQTPPSPVAAATGKGAPIAPRFTAEETILLRGLASGSSSKEMATQMRLPRESLYRLIGDLRRKTGASSDTSLAVWVLRNLGSGGGERRGGGR
jgi:DNA-binding CsgD family transcriptional regulator